MLLTHRSRRREGQKPDHLNRGLIHLAAEHGRLGFLEHLLVPGCNLKRKDYRGFTPLHCAASKGYIECTTTLVEAGADLHTKDEHSRSAIDLACINGHGRCVVRLLRLGAIPSKVPTKKVDVSIAKLIRISGEVLEDAPEGKRDIALRRKLVKKKLAWVRFDTVCKDFQAALSQSTGIPQEILDIIIERYISSVK